MPRNLNLPNALSAYRIASVPVMIWCTASGHARLFTWLFFAALMSDILDGLIARTFHLQTRLGAQLDSCADMGTYLSAVTGLFIFQQPFLLAHWVEIAVILLFYTVEKTKTFFHYRRPFNAFHTYLSKATAYAQGIFILSLFFWGFKSYLFYPAMVLCITANIEEMLLTSLLPQNEHDVRGLFWVIKRKKNGSAAERSVQR